MTSILPPLLVCAATGATASTCGTLRRTSAIFTETGEPPKAEMNEEPGGRTRISAPVPAVRFLLSFRIPSESPTISRMSVTSTAIATMLMSDRIGRCTRLEMTIFFICVPSTGYRVPRKQDLLAGRVGVFLLLFFLRARCRRLVFALQVKRGRLSIGPGRQIQSHYFRARGLWQFELRIFHRLVQGEL